MTIIFPELEAIFVCNTSEALSLYVTNLLTYLTFNLVIKLVDLISPVSKPFLHQFLKLLQINIHNNNYCFLQEDASEIFLFKNIKLNKLDKSFLPPFT